MKNRSKKKILVTGSAGFIGYHFCEKVLKNSNYSIYGIENLNSYYSVDLKKDRIQRLKKYKNFHFKKIDISDFKALKSFYLKNKIDVIFNFAAQAGVRYSLVNPESYIKSNLKGFANVLDIAKIKKTKIIYASSSSVYGDQKKFPIKEEYRGEQKNLYAHTKAKNEELASLYSKKYRLPLMGLRFFTVYGEWGRPDML